MAVIFCISQVRQPYSLFNFLFSLDQFIFSSSSLFSLLLGGMELLRVGLGVGSWGRCMSGRKSTSPLFVCHSSILRMASPNAASWNQSESLCKQIYLSFPA